MPWPVTGTLACPCISMFADCSTAAKNWAQSFHILENCKSAAAEREPDPAATQDTAAKAKA